MRNAALVLLLALSPFLARPVFAQEETPDIAPAPPPSDEDVPPGPEAQPPAQPPTQQTFDQQLSPYGRWVDTPEYGRVWIPNAGPDFQPYADGRWVDTTDGWSFVSPVPWGWIAFHYGRWGWRDGWGWYWIPGYRWAPAWVAWRHVNGFACWAPLGPRGYVYGPRWRGWVVVPHEHFTHPIRRWAVPRAQAFGVVRSARSVRGFSSYRAPALTGRGGGGHHGSGRRR